MKPYLKEPSKPRRTPLVDWSEVAQLCRKHPGKFVLVGEQLPHSLVTALARGRMSLIDMTEFEYRTENNTFLPDTINGRRCDLYLRFVGPTGKDK